MHTDTCRLLVLLWLMSTVLITPQRTSAATYLYPDLKTLRPRDLQFARADIDPTSAVNIHNVLRFTNTVWNAGPGRMEIWSTINPSTHKGTAYQRVYDTSGSYTQYAVGTLYYHDAPGHMHYHFDNWGKYQLWTRADYDKWIASGRTQGQAKKVGTKATACILDGEFVQTRTGTPYPGKYPFSGCQPNSHNVIKEGISIGWGDTYDYYLFEQWIDLGQEWLSDGDYVLRSVTDPLNKLYESANKALASRDSVQANEGVTFFSVQDGKLVDTRRPSGTVRINDVAASTTSVYVTVKVLGRDDVAGVDRLRLSNNGTSWKTYTYSAPAPGTSVSIPTAVSWNLADPSAGGNSSSGTKTVYVQTHDRAAKWSPTFTDQIVLKAATSLTSYGLIAALTH
ncbi:MAG: hypothetical protein M3328_07330 [Chloroflexota bacterium]|nr:hypothetical protein [Chloroflexota bacterium]